MPRIAPAMLAFALALAGVAASPAAPAAAHSSSCTGWTSTSVPPTYIRVGRIRLGRVDKVPFRRYVEVVMTREWGDSIPYELQRAGAVAATQYAWFWTRAGKWRGGSIGGRCYDVKDTTADQLYRPGLTVSERMKRAVSSVWGWTVWRDGRFVHTWYALGDRDVWCARDAGNRLYVRSARKCANKLGWTAARILRTYYSASVRTW